MINLQRPLQVTSLTTTLVRASVVALLVLSTNLPALAEIRFVPLDSGTVQEMRSSSAALASSPQPLEGPGNVLLLPSFEVGGTQTSQTTLFGIRNVALIGDTTVDITYYDVSGNITAVEFGVSIPANGVYPRNLNQVAGLPSDPDGFKRGFVTIAGPNAVSGEYFQMDPDNAFATGGRLVANGELCFISDTRFIQGGPFTGGTQFQMFINSPQGTQINDPLSASFTVANEAGTIIGDVGIQTDQVVNDFSIGDLISALPGGIGPSFGSALVVFPAPGYGLLTTTFSASGLYSVGVPASCQTLAP